MKKISFKKTVFILTVTTIVIVCVIWLPGYSRYFSPKTPAPPPVSQYLIDDQNNIVGTFISDDDNLSKWVFDASGNCYSYCKLPLNVTHVRLELTTKSLLTLNFETHEKRKIYRSADCICNEETGIRNCC
ncbi:hypothetical protein [Asinibacterium sp. OR53]|uniref:hypothetical protein n=1 Tax=Asinibacterium sp. OR53 TaxID=925409 RepID=UPI0012F75880|nr:hypothetical protein [Asinibacterium sp. OR53]